MNNAMTDQSIKLTLRDAVYVGGMIAAMTIAYTDINKEVSVLTQKVVDEIEFRKEVSDRLRHLEGKIDRIIERQVSSIKRKPT